jgi:hypothetical protein
MRPADSHGYSGPDSPVVGLGFTARVPNSLCSPSWRTVRHRGADNPALCLFGAQQLLSEVCFSDFQCRTVQSLNLDSLMLFVGPVSQQLFPSVCFF